MPPELHAAAHAGAHPPAFNLRRFAFATGGVLLPVVAAALFAGNLALHWPGTLNNDSIGQLQQATTGQYADWHPPVMAWVWSLLLHVGSGPAPMLLFHLALYWLGVALLADGVRRGGQPQLAWLVLAAGAFPPFLYLNGTITKDTGMVAAWMAAVGLVLWYRAQRRRIAWPAAVGIALALAYGTLVRTNAIFALGPLLLLLFARRPATWTRLALATGVAAVLALPAGAWINTHLIGARAEEPVQSLFMYDLLGIAAHTGDPGVLEPRATLTAAQVQACYTPYWWDPMSPWGRCAALVHRPADIERVTLPQGLAQQWLATIASHPVAYAQHRLRHFNSSLLFLVPRKHIRFVPEYQPESGGMKPFAIVTPAEIKGDLLRKNFVTWPVTWVTWGVFLLAWLLRRPGADACSAMALALSASALGYSASYLLVGVATDMRYHYWSLLALLMATLLVLPALWRGIRQRTPVLMAGLGMVALVVILGTAARVADWRGLF